MSQYGWSNCPDLIRHQLDRLTTGLRAAVHENLVGVYLHGSLALGCFNPHRSDLDLLAVTRAGLDATTPRGLAELLLVVSGRPAPVEISVLRRSDLHPWRYPTPYDFHYSEDWRDRMTARLAADDWREPDPRPRDPDLAAHITVTRRRGVCLLGSPVAAVFPAVPRTDYLDSLRLDVLSDEFGLTSTGAPPVYAVLNGCRTYAYLVDGKILSKEEGGVWALHHLPRVYREALQAALHAYRHDGDDAALDPAAALALASYLREQIEPFLSPPDTTKGAK